MAKKKPSLADRIKADPKLRAKYLANPGLRSKLPASALTPAQRRQRATNTALARPVTPGSAVTNRALGAEADNATAVRYGPQERALQTQQAKAEQQGHDVAGWWDAYQAELRGHQANAQAINATAVGQMQQTGAGLRALDQSQLTAQQQSMNTDAATRGATAPNLAPEASNASQVRQAMLAGFANQQASTGAATGQYASTLARVVGPGQKLQARAQSAQGVRDVADKLTGLQADKGAYNQNYRAGRISDEQKNVLAMQALGLDAKKAQADASTDAARVDIARGVDPVTGKAIVKPQAPETSSQKLARQRDEAQRRNKTGPYAPAGAKTPAARQKKVAENNKFRQSVQTAASDARYALDKPVPVVDPTTGEPTGKTRRRTEGEVRAGLRKKYKDRDIANAAMDMAILGYISPENERRLRARGIAIPKEWRRKPKGKVTKKTAGGVAGVVAGAA